MAGEAGPRGSVERIGILGGAFNPPHIGHLVLAQEATVQLDLARVLLMPTGRPPHKRIDPEPGAEVRLEMARLAADPDERLEASDLELRRDGPSYTFRTLESLSDERPGAELVFLMGADMAATIESWMEPRRILELARAGIAARPGTEIDAVHRALERLGAGERAETVQMPQIGISSTEIRERVGMGRPIRYLVPDPVERLIRERGLYRR